MRGNVYGASPLYQAVVVLLAAIPGGARVEGITHSRCFARQRTGIISFSSLTAGDVWLEAAGFLDRHRITKLVIDLDPVDRLKRVAVFDDFVQIGKFLETTLDVNQTVVAIIVDDGTPARYFVPALCFVLM
jgi:hypothetical protein